MKTRDLVILECLKCKTHYKSRKKNVLEYLKMGGLNGSFCSAKCASSDRKTSIKTQCSYCKKEIIKIKNQFEKSNTHFCSSSCSAKYWNNIYHPIENRKIIIPKKPAEKVELICATCSKIFIKYKSALQPIVNNVRFCSRSCQAIYANKTWNRSPRFGINKSRCETILKNIILVSLPNLNIKENDRTIIPNGLELDLYIPEKNVAIELNGPCHFIPLFGDVELQKTQNKDLIKMKYCQDNNIKLFIINVMGVRNQQQMLQETFDNQLKPHLI